MNNEKGFTLIEMMVVLMIITVLLIITIPNMTKHNGIINEKGCDAYQKMLQAQVQTYEMENGSYPANLEVLKDKKYISSIESTCGPDQEITISTTGEVILKDIATPPPTTTTP